MAERDPLDRAFAPTTPDDLLDPPQFSQITETTKDVLVYELRKFFDSAQQTPARRGELVTVEKYATFGDGNDPQANAATIVRKFPERLENLPHIAVMTAAGQERKLTVGPPYVATVQDPARVVAVASEPYALNDGDSIVFRTLPDAVNEFLDTIVFTADRFPTAAPIGAALAVDVARVINEQGAHIHASAVTVGSDTFLQVEAGGPLSSEQGRTPTEIEVVSSSSTVDIDIFQLAGEGSVATIEPAYPSTLITAAAGAWSVADIGKYLTVSGADRPYFNNGRFKITDFSTDFTTDTLTIANRYGREELTGDSSWYLGDRDDHFNPAHPPKNRYGMSFDLGVQIDVLTEDENTRSEVVDLVLAFFAFFLEQKYFTFLGRSGFQGQTVDGEFYQIVINPPLHSTAENEFPRPGDGTGKVYVNSFNIDVTTSMFIDRELFYPGTNTPFIAGGDNIVRDDTLPPSN